MGPKVLSPSYVVQRTKLLEELAYDDTDETYRSLPELKLMNHMSCSTTRIVEININQIEQESLFQAAFGTFAQLQMRREGAIYICMQASAVVWAVFFPNHV